MSINRVSYYIGDELEPLQLWWTANGSLVDFSVTHTYTLKVASISDPSTLLFTKTSGFTGAAGSGTKTSGVPNLSVAWATSGELNSITAAGRYTCQIVALRSADGKERTGVVNLDMFARI